MLEEAIRLGEYRAGDQLPAEQDLATRFGVSYTTARRAVSDLVLADFLERRGRKGTFVRGQSVHRLQQTTLHLICSTYINGAAEAFILNATRAAEARGWNVNVLRLAMGQQDLAVRALASGNPALICLDEIRETSSLGIAVRAARDRVVVLQPDMSAIGVTTVLTRLEAHIDMLLGHLRAAGHQQIAMIVQIPKDEKECSTSWQRHLTAALRQIDLCIDVIYVDTPPGYSPMRRAYEEVGDYLKSHPNVTALASMGEELTIGAMGACRDANLSVPDQISLVNDGDTPLLELVSPAITCVDHNMGLQCEEAVRLVAAHQNGLDTGAALHIVQSRLVDRGSVACVRSAPHAAAV